MSAAVAVWAVTLLIGLAAQPMTAWALRGLPGAGAGLARPFGLLLAAFPVWLLASLQILPYSTATAWLAVVLLVAAGVFVALRHRRGGDPRHRRLLLGGSEVVFTVAFLVGLLLVSHRPDVWGTERPLDMALVNTIDASRHFPPLDPWLSGHDLNYYYLGQYLMAFVIRLAGVPTDEGYNICVALVWAMGASAAFGLGGAAAALLRGWRGTLMGGLALTGLGIVGGNVYGAWRVLAHDGPIESLNWFSASRVVPGAVNDFPVFELIIGDLHAHVIAVPYMLLGLAFALHVAVHGPVARERAALAGLVLGAVYAINAWSAPALLAVLIGAVALHRRPLRRLVTWAAVLTGTALVAFLPFHLSTSTGGTKGIGFVPERRPLGEFVVDQLAMYGFALVPALIVVMLRLTPLGRLLVCAGVILAVPLAVADDLANPALALTGAAAAGWLAWQPERAAVERFGALLLCGGLGCIAVQELVYLRDAFDGGQYFRFNTAFKVGFDAWVLITASAALLLAATARHLARDSLLLAVIAVGAISFPPYAAWAHMGGFRGDAHLDGLRWLSAIAPGDPPAIAWLRENTPRGAVVLEANGPEYSAQGHARISVFTGRPTVLGWAGHELFYHPPSALGTRADDIRRMYETGDPALLRRYRVRYVVVGPIERQTYPALRTDALGEIVFSREGTEVYRIG